MKSSGRASWLGVLPLFLFLGACTGPVINLEEPAEVETCEWLIPVGIELVNDYFYTLLETDLGATRGDSAALPPSIAVLNARGAELDLRAAQLECDLVELNRRIVEGIALIETDDPVAQEFLAVVHGGVVGPSTDDYGRTVHGSWVLTQAVIDGEVMVPLTEDQVVLVIDDEPIRGFSGCNSYSGGYRIEGDEWVTDDVLAGTVKGCGGEVGLLETVYINGLADITSFSLDNDVLVLTGPDLEFRFDRRGPVPSAGD